MGGIGQAIGSSIGGLFSSGGQGGINGKGVENRTVGIDPDTQAAMDAQAAHAGRSQSDFKNDLTQGTDQTQQLQGAEGAQAMHNQSLAMNNPQGVQDALNNRANRSYQRDNLNLNKKAGLQATQNKFNEQKTAYSDADKQQQVLAGIAQRKRAQQEGNANFRNQIIGNLFQSIGGAGGTAWANSKKSGGAMSTSNTQSWAGADSGSASDAGTMMA